MEEGKDLIRAIETAMDVNTGPCSCSHDDDHLCNKCFVDDTLLRCHRWIVNRLSVRDYTEAVNQAAIYPGKDRGIVGIIYCILGLVGEAGEVANQLKHELRDNQAVVDELNAINHQGLGMNLEKLLEEDGDALFYVTRLAVECGYKDIRQLMGDNIIKVAEKRQKILEARRLRESSDKCTDPTCDDPQCRGECKDY